MLLVERDEPRFESYWSALQAFGCSYEGGQIKLSIGHRQMYSVDVPPSADINGVVTIFEHGEIDGTWMYQEGYRYIT